MNETVLSTVKQVLGLTPEQTEFDAELITHINSALFDLNFIGVGEWRVDFGIASPATTWGDVLAKDIPAAAKQYVALKVKKAFDPPTSTMVNESLNNLIQTLEWRLEATVDREENS